MYIYIYYIYIYKYIYIYIHNSSDTSFFKGGEVNFDYFPRKGGGQSEKFYKGGGTMVQGQVFLKGGA